MKKSQGWGVCDKKQLSLSHLKIHREMTKSTIAGWVEIIFKTAGINICRSKTHSCMSASSLKATVIGLSLESIWRRQRFRKSIWQKHNTPVANLAE